MKVIAETINGLNVVKQVTVTNITEKNLPNLLNEVKESNQMQVYVNCIVEKLNGVIDASNSTPLYTNGQQSVRKLRVDDEIVWEK
jgi:hypothetical protein